MTRTLNRQPTPIVANVPPLRIAIYGEGGVGKTTFALTFPKPLVIDTDSGLEGDTVIGATGEQWNPDKWSDLNDLYFWLKEQVKTKGYQTVVVDSIDTLCKNLLREATASASTSRVKDELETTLITSEKRDYNKVANAMYAFLTNLKILNREHGVNIVLLSAVRLPDIEQGRRKRTFDVQAAVEGIVTHWANVYGELELLEVPTGKKDAKGADIMEDKRVLWTKASDPRRQSKSRFSALTPGVVNPTFEKMRKLIADRVVTPTTPARAATTKAGK